MRIPPSPQSTPTPHATMDMVNATFDRIKQQKSPPQNKVVRLPESPTQRYAEWCYLDKRYHNGEVLDVFENRWYESYQQSNEFKLLQKQKRSVND